MSRSGRFRAGCLAVLAAWVVVVEACGSGTGSSTFHGVGEADGSVADTSPAADTGGGQLLGDATGGGGGDAAVSSLDFQPASATVTVTGTGTLSDAPSPRPSPHRRRAACHPADSPR